MRLLKKCVKRCYFRRGIVYFLTFCMFFNISVPAAMAGPEGAQVVNGQVSFQQSGNNTVITASDKAIINYSGFDIARPEIVQFIQPGSRASVLNRILSANPTHIDGTLLANGRVFFLNPAGVIIGSGARINVNQLVASALDISNSDFIEGRYNFTGGDGAVINSGDISAEKVYLIGKQVANYGNISCPAGYVVMAAGERVFLGEPGTDVVLEIETMPSDLGEPVEAAAGVLNEGTLDAAGGEILLAAGDIYSQAISNTGTLSASVETGNGGQIRLAAAGGEVTNTGTIEASGSEGGQIEMEGTRVGQFGTVHADGIDSHGGSVDLWASEVVALSSESLTTANAGLNGDGGEVIVYSPDTALFWADAKIEAKGGIESGDGGFVEVSGKNHVEIYGLVDASATSGAAGTFLIDPTDITIVDTDTATPDLEDPLAGDPRLFETTNATNEITDDTIEILLNNGTSVTLDTSHDDGGGPYGGIGDIVQNSDAQINKTAGGPVTLTLLAENNIDLDGGIVATSDTLGVVLTATGNVDIDAAVTTNGGSFISSGINFDNTDSAITTTGGGVTLDHGGDVTIGGTISAGTGSVSITAGGAIHDAADDALVDIVADLVTLTAQDEIGVDPLSGFSNAALEMTVASLDASSTVAGDIVIAETDGITLTDVDTFAGDIVITAGGSLSAGSVIATDGSVGL
ncbi:MAG: two-partner secretion domain-containing protein, partial [Planctomycetota bacterium]